MSAATQDETKTFELDPLVAQPADTVDYMARREELRMTLKARYPRINPVTGAREGMTRGIFPGFRAGLLRLPKTGMVKIVDTLDGGESEEVDVAEIHAQLQTHRLFGDRSEGFWLLEHPAPPVSREELDRLQAAASSWDDETLAAIAKQEREGWNREDIIRVAEGTLERIAVMRAQVAEVEREAERKLAEEREERAKIEATLAAAQEMARKAEERAKKAEAAAKAKAKKEGE